MNRLIRFSVLASLAVAALPLSAQAQPALEPAIDRLVRSDRSSLEVLYRSADAGSMPLGAFDGRATGEPGTSRGARQSKRIGLLWKGKEFPGDGTMVNRLAFGVRAVRAEAYYGESWLDVRPSIILDYVHTSRLFGKARDEMREISPGVYLGLTYLRRCPEPKLVAYFAIEPHAGLFVTQGSAALHPGLYSSLRYPGFRCATPRALFFASLPRVPLRSTLGFILRSNSGFIPTSRSVRIMVARGWIAA